MSENTNTLDEILHFMHVVNCQGFDHPALTKLFHASERNGAHFLRAEMSHGFAESGCHHYLTLDELQARSDEQLAFLTSEHNLLGAETLERMRYLVRLAEASKALHDAIGEVSTGKRAASSYRAPISSSVQNGLGLPFHAARPVSGMP